MASPLEDIELQVMEVGDASDPSSQTGESVEGSVSSSSDDEDDLSSQGESDDEISSSEDGSGASSSDGSPAPVATVDKGKQRAGQPPKSILKKDTAKDRTDTASSEDRKPSKNTKHCARCGRPVKKSYLRKIDRPSNVADEQAVVKNTIHNLEVYATDDPVAVLCDRCGAAASKLDQYKSIAIEGQRLVKSPLTRSMSNSYAREVIAREKFLAALNEKSRRKRSNGKPAATVSFTEPSSSGDTGAQSDDDASIISSVSRVSIGSLPPPVDGVGAARPRRNFYRAERRHYVRGRWSWDAARERGDLEDYDDSSDPSNAGESSTQGAAQGKSQEKKDDEVSSRGWLDTSGRNVKYYEFYGTPKTKEDKEEEKKEAKKAKSPQWLEPETHTIRRKRKGSVSAEAKYLAKAWCCFPS
ncbi:hypothetical protein IWX90DRAFT_414991 [Phyllosticta citrichinensis]|uniref:ZAD domain-containing protein n=1 Tax=Phyllosticta citrichinensis TaxID=1130410 RepID=A0ABR1XU04_9PEZI